MNPTTKIFENKKSIARYIGELFTELSLEKRELNICLSGGSTPKTIFEVLSHEFANKINWSNLRFFWGDERCVPPNHPESNFGMTREHLFDHVAIKTDNIFRVKGELKPKEAVNDYISVIEANVPIIDNTPQFDLLFLGMGSDGHTASIFPYQIELWNSSNSCGLAQHPDTGQFRVTLTGKVINHSKLIIFLVTGEDKAAKVEEIIHQTGNYESYPASLVNRNRCIWLLDEDAAKQL